MEIAASFGDWVRRRRRALDLTQGELANRIGCAHATIRKIETDERRPSKQLAELLAQHLQIPAEERIRFLQVARGDRMVEQLASVGAITSPQTARSLQPMPNAPAKSAPEATTAPPAPSRPLSPTLPLSPNPLVGRTVELAEVKRLLAQPNCRLLTLVGPGGIGKTRLALAAAQEIRDVNVGRLEWGDGADPKAIPPGSHPQAKFSDGVYFVALAPLAAPEFIVTAIAHTIGFTFVGPAAPTTQLLGYLRTKQMLLLLDNLEHLLTGVDLFMEILQSAPGVKLLATSRERLNLQTEWVFDLQGLPIPLVTEDKIDSYSAVALFVARARQVQTAFALSKENQSDVIRICRLVEGMPLGIELAAAWVHVLSCQEIAQEIEQNIDFLAAMQRDMPSRHRSLRATFDHSWRLLSPQEQQVLCRLAVFQGGFQREAAEKVARATLHLLAALVDKSLVRRTTTQRYDLHELVRQFVREQLEQTGEVQSTNRFHLLYYLGLAETAEPQLTGADQVDWLNQLEREYDNLRAALAWSLASGNEEAALRLSSALKQFWEVRGYITEGRRWLDQALAQSDHAAKSLRAKALQAAGLLAFEHHDISAAQNFFTASLALRRELADEAEAATVIYHLGRVAWRQGDWAQARALYSEALTFQRAQGNRAGMAKVLGGLGVLAMSIDDFENAVSFLEESVALDKALGNRKDMARSLFNLGLTTVRMENGSGRAAAYFEASVALCREIGYPKIAAYAINNLAMLTLHEGDAQRARALAQESLTLCRAAEDQLGVFYALINLGHSTLDQGDFRQAIQYFQESLAPLEQVDSHSRFSSLAWLVEGWVRALKAKPACAVQLAGAAAALRETWQATLPPTARVYFEPTLTTLHTQLGEAAFTAAWAAGQTLTPEQTIAYALANLSN